jgi:phage gp36-like protein
LLREVSLALAAYFLYRRKTAEPPKAVVDDYRDALGVLDKVLAGEIRLLEGDKSSGYLCNKTAGDRFWPKSILDQF